MSIFVGVMLIAALLLIYIINRELQAERQKADYYQNMFVELSEEILRLESELKSLEEPNDL